MSFKTAIINPFHAKLSNLNVQPPPPPHTIEVVSR